MIDIYTLSNLGGIGGALVESAWSQQLLGGSLVGFVLDLQLTEQPLLDPKHLHPCCCRSMHLPGSLLDQEGHGALDLGVDLHQKSPGCQLLPASLAANLGEHSAVLGRLDHARGVNWGWIFISQKGI